MRYEVIKSLREEREREKAALHNFPESERANQNKLDEGRYFEKWEEYLDKAEFGPRWLSQPEIADIMKEALHYRDGKVFDLHTFCIMSNHVHVVFGPLRKSDWQSDPQGKSGWQPDLQSDYQSDILDLPKIMQSLKRHTARQANKIFVGLSMGSMAVDVLQSVSRSDTPTYSANAGEGQGGVG